MAEPLRIMSLHALAYCERLFYLEEVEEMRVADERVYAGRRLHVELEKKEGRTRKGNVAVRPEVVRRRKNWVQASSTESAPSQTQPDDDVESEKIQLSLESVKWGLTGKVDCIRRRDGLLIPYEHKRGRSARSVDNKPEAWASDRLQVIAYAAMVAEHSGQEISEGRIRYHADNAMVRVPIDEQAFGDLKKSIARARLLQSTVERPPVADNERLCVRCSLAPVCLPEEARLAQQPDHKTIRLFPADDDRQVLHVLTLGAKVGRKGDQLEVTAKEAEPQRYPVQEVGQVVLHGFAQITTQALRLCAEREVGVHWVTMGGRYMGAWSAGAGPVQRRIRQYKALTDPAVCLRLAKQ